MIRCNCCNVEFATKKGLHQHTKGKGHINRVNGTVPKNAKYKCNCGKTYSYRQSLHVHKMTCAVPTTSVVDMIEKLQNTVQEERRQRQLEREESLKEREESLKEREEYLKEREELRTQISLLIDKQATTSTNCNNTNIIETQQNITININAFGNENTDYLDDKAILACVGRVYKSIPSLLEKIHFDPKHPENHNIKISNKKLPYASVMGINQKWKTVDRKDAIETMVINGYNMLDEKYTENKDKIPVFKQQNFEGFQSKFESDDKELMKQLKNDVDMMILNGGSA